MTGKKGWSRREFVQTMGTAAIGTRAFGATQLFGSQTQALHDASFVYVGCSSADFEGIEVLAVKDGGLQRVQRIASRNPASIVLSSDNKMLYAVNAISQHGGLPRGTVESYAISSSGQLTMLGQQELSLSATMPRHAALSPDGTRLLVTSQGGGLYNVLPVTADGSLGRVSGIFKVTGDTSGRAALPQMTIFDRKGRAITADAGTGRVSVLAAADASLIPHAQTAIDGEASLHHVALHESASALYVARDGSIERYGYDHETGNIRDLQQKLSYGARALTLHPSNKLLLSYGTENGIRSWRVASDGSLRNAGSYGAELGRLAALNLSSNGTILTISSERDEITAAQLNPSNGQISTPRTLLALDSPRSMAVMYI